MKAKLTLKGQEVVIEDIKEVKGFDKFIGLMFKSAQDAKPLLFDFGNMTRKAIHSHFVKFPFVAIWLDFENKVVDYKLVNPGSSMIKPEVDFQKLLEVPLNEQYSFLIGFLDEEKV